jgi:hypothetical protein
MAAGTAAKRDRTRAEYILNDSGVDVLEKRMLKPIDGELESVMRTSESYRKTRDSWSLVKMLGCRTRIVTGHLEIFYLPLRCTFLYHDLTVRTHHEDFTR